MNTTIWVFQGLLAFIFMFSGINKAYFDEKTLIKKGQTGVKGLSKWFIKFIGISEIFGAIALILPLLINKWTILIPAAAICLGSIMIPAAYLHWKNKEYKNVVFNMVIFIICGFVTYFRMG